MRAIPKPVEHLEKSAEMTFPDAARPAVTPMLILKALLGVVLFFSGIVFGVWLIIRRRRRLA